MINRTMENDKPKNGESPHYIQEKRKLLQIASQQYESELKDQVDQLSKNVRRNASQWGKNLAVMGGTLFVAYQLFRKFSTPPVQEVEATHQIVVEQPEEEEFLPKKRYKKKSRRKSKLMDTVKQNIALILLSAAQQKLLEFLEKQQANGKKSVSNSAQQESE